MAGFASFKEMVAWLRDSHESQKGKLRKRRRGRRGFAVLPALPTGRDKGNVYRASQVNVNNREDRKGPTRCLPGTVEKIKVMADRASRKVGLFHPEDAPMLTKVEEGLRVNR